MGKLEDARIQRLMSEIPHEELQIRGVADSTSIQTEEYVYMCVVH